MPAHCAPLGIEFFKGQSCGVNGAFPCSMEGNVIVAQRGSWNRDIPSGYKVMMYPFNNGNPTGEEVTVAYDDNPPGNWRPVNAVFNQNGHLLVSSDSQGHITKVTYGSPPPTIRAVRNLD
jgi:glucose/arabinose dehydrogenase